MMIFVLLFVALVAAVVIGLSKVIEEKKEEYEIIN
jgi:Na+-transporting methylmalonyl-CoA/oxaloacetate decarboxylase gamma subunit